MRTLPEKPPPAQTVSLIMLSDTVKAAASGRWDEILRHLCGLSEAETTPGKQGMPCPCCAGHDRYEFKSVDDGFHLCRGCGAGDGFAMVTKMLRCDFAEALKQVAEYLRIGSDKHVPLHDVRRKEAPKAKLSHDAIARKACSLWQRTTDPDPQHPYLLKKHLPPLKLRQYRDSLVAPVYSPEHTLVNLQFIRPDGSKTFLKNGRVIGCYVWWGCKSWSVYVCEGVATGISLYLSLHRLIITAFSAGNIIHVAKHLRETLPGHRLVLVPDNDAPTATRKWRAGMAALYGHNFFDEVMLLPEGKDASDLWIDRHGR